MQLTKIHQVVLRHVNVFSSNLMPRNCKLMDVAADFYQLFGLQRDADITSVKRSYRRLAKEYHPDKNLGDPFAKDLFQKINEAYSVLSDPVKRIGYDNYLDEKTRLREQKQMEKSYAKQSIFDTIMNFGQEDSFVEDTVGQDQFADGYGESYGNNQSESHVGYSQPQISASADKTKTKKMPFKLSSLPSTHYFSLFLMAVTFMFVPSQGSGLALVWLFYGVHAALSSWWIYRVRHQLPKDKVAMGGLILMTHVLSASLSMLFLLPFTLVIYYMR